MKSKTALLWFVVALGLGGLLVVQWRQHREQQAKIEQLQLQAEKLTSETRTSAAKVEELQRQEAALRQELAAAQDKAAQANAAASATPMLQTRITSSKARAPGSGQANDQTGAGNFLANMMKDPEMRKAMQEQQRMGLNMMYGTLFKQLQLAPEQEQKLKDMLLDQQMENMSHAGDLLGAGSDRAEAMKKIAEEQKQRQDQIKEMLGEEKYGQFEQYSQTMGERMMLDQFGKDVEISPDQKEQLLAIVLEEKKNAQINASPQPGLTKDFQNAIASPELMEKLIAQQEEVNERVLERAGNVLTLDQVRKLGPVLNSQLEMQRAGAKMAQQMFKNPATGQGKE